MKLFILLVALTNFGLLNSKTVNSGAVDASVTNFSKRFNMGRKAHTQPYKKQFQYTKEAVATDHDECSQIGEAILSENGTAIDATIASVFCLGVVNPHSSGIGGGGFALVHFNSSDEDESNSHVKFIDFREQAPACLDQKDLSKEEASKGGKSIAIPGELKGMYTMWKKYGKLEWPKLLKPSIDLAKNGFKIGKALAIAIDRHEKNIMNNTGLRNLFTKEGKILKENHVLKNEKLAAFLEKLSNITSSIEEFYEEGDILETMVKEINTAGGCVELEDFQNYKVRVEDPIEIEFENFVIYTGNAPTSGPLLAFILNTMKKLSIDKHYYSTKKLSYYHHLIEILKFAYSLRANLADHEYESISRKTVKNILEGKYSETAAKRIKSKPYSDADKYQLISNSSKVDLKTSTTHLNVLDRYGNAVSLTSTINGYFGSNVVSDEFGFIYNNQIDDFSFQSFSNAYSLPYSHVNALKPGKRPQSSALLAIAFEYKEDETGSSEKRSKIFRRVPIPKDTVTKTDEKNNDISKDDRANGIFLVGGSGGSIITSAVAQSLINHLILKMSLKQSIDQPRLHNQLTPNTVFLEDDFDKDLYKSLKELGHKVEYNSIHHAVVQGISTIENGDIDKQISENDKDSSDDMSSKNDDTDDKDNSENDKDNSNDEYTDEKDNSNDDYTDDKDNSNNEDIDSSDEASRRKSIETLAMKAQSSTGHSAQPLRRIFAESDYRKGGHPAGL